MTCTADPTAGFAARVLDYVDCQAQAIGTGGFHALGMPGSIMATAMAGLLTIFIALFGYRMLLGRTPGLHDGVLAAVKVGIVLTLAFSWPAYRTLVYDVAFKAPAELAGEIGRPAALPGSAGGLVARLDYADNGFVALGLLGTGAGGPPAEARAAPRPAPSAFDPLALGGARVIYLTAAVGALAALRMIAGIMLALGPVFAAFLLFEGTRGLFEGWIRVLAGTAFGALGTALIVGIELALLEPWLVQLITWRNAGYATPGAPTELLVVALVFALAILAVITASWRLAVGFGLPATWRAAPQQLREIIRGDERQGRAPSDKADVIERSRATRVAQAMTGTLRREAAVTGGAMPPRLARPHESGQERGRGPQVPLGQSYRRTRQRVSGSAARRDRTS